MVEMWRNEGEGAAKQTIKLEINPFSQLSIGVLETISIADQRWHGGLREDYWRWWEVEVVGGGGGGIHQRKDQHGRRDRAQVVLPPASPSRSRLSFRSIRKVIYESIHRHHHSNPHWCVSLSISIHLSSIINPSIHLPIHPPLHPFTRRLSSIHLPIHPPIHSFTHLSSFRLSISHPSNYPSIHLN